MGQFKQRPKMKTTEPSVILKLKKGGHVNAKLLQKGENGFSPMSSSPKFRESMEPESGDAPKKPSMAARKKAMNPNFKDGGQVQKKGLGGMIKRIQEQAAQAAKSKAPASMPSKIAPQIGKELSNNNIGGGLFGGLGKMVGNAVKAPMPMIKNAVEAAKSAPKAPPPAVGKPLSNANFGDIGRVVSGLTKGLKPGLRMKDGGDVSQDKAMIKKAMQQHDAQEHPGGSGTKLSLKTGGVTKGNGGGYKTGGVIKGNGGGYKTGGVALGQGGFKAGGSASKKAYATGGNVNDEGAAVKMPRRPVSRPVANSLQSGTFAKGGKVEKEEKPNLRLVKTHTGPGGHVAKTYKDKDWGEYRTKFFTPDGKHKVESDNHTDDLDDALHTAQSQVNKGYMRGGSAKKYKDGGSTGDDAYTVKNPKAVSDKASRELEDALNPIDMVKELAGKAKDYFIPPAGSVTKTEKSVTVTPSKRNGGRASR